MAPVTTGRGTTLRDMIDFALKEEQRDVRAMCHACADKEIRPRAWELNRDGTWPQQISTTRSGSDG